MLALPHIATKGTNKTKTNTNSFESFFFSRTSSSKELRSPAPPSSPGGEATLGLESFAEVVHKGHRELTHPPSAVEVSFSIYSQNMNHIIILISAFHRLPKSCQLFPGSPWEGEDGEREEIRAAVATGVRVL